MTPSEPAVVLDTAALLAGLGPAQAGPGQTRWVVPPEVRAEISPGGPTGRALERAILAGLEVVGPDGPAANRVMDAVRRQGEADRLSEADLAVLALAETLRSLGHDPVSIWTDDYSVQNMAKVLGIETRSIMTRGARHERTWHIRCTGCGRYLDETPKDGVCPICGSPLKQTSRAPKRRKR